MKNLLKKSKMLFVLPMLLGITLLLLEIPRLYYKKWDENLLEEEGSSKYETQIIKNMDDFGQKMDAFRDYNNTSTIGNLHLLEDEEIKETAERLLAEIEALSAELYKITHERMQQTKVEGRGIEAQIIRFSDLAAKNEQYIWEVGFFELYFPMKSRQITITFFYDVDTYKIFQVEWSFPIEEDFRILFSIDEDSVLKYYDGIVDEEFTVINYLSYGMISPFSIDSFYESRLITELYSFRDYYWGVTEIE